MAKKKSLQDKYLPIAKVPRLNQLAKPAENQNVMRKIIQGAVQGAFSLKLPTSYDLKYKKETIPKMLASTEQIEFVTHLIESLQPQDAIEAALASQFAITYIRGLEDSQEDNCVDRAIRLFEFGHQCLETLTKFRTKGAQLISVQYNHNQGMINNINIDKQEATIEV